MGAEYLGLQATGWDRMTETWWQRVSAMQFCLEFQSVPLATPNSVHRSWRRVCLSRLYLVVYISCT
jgi:hypothetical protein